MDIPRNYMRILIDNVNWERLSEKELPENFIEMFWDNLNMEKVMHYSVISESFIEKHASKLFQSEDKVKDELILTEIAGHQKLSETFINKYMTGYPFLWSYLCTFQRLSEYFMNLHKQELDWRAISINQRLSEDFMSANKDKLYWKGISINQLPLSEPFLEEFKEYIDWEEIVKQQRLSPVFSEKMKHYL